MPDVREAHEILGVGKNAGKAEIEKKYEIILKKRRLQSMQGQESGISDTDFMEATRAYNILMGYEDPKEEEDKKSDSLLSKVGIDEKKAGNFLYYHKWHIIVTVLLLIAAVSIVKHYVTRVEPDFNIGFIGAINYFETDALKNRIKAEIPDIKEPGFDGAYLAPEGKEDDQQPAMYTKAELLFIAGDIDLFVVSSEIYKKYAEAGGFISLDEMADSLGIDKAKNSENMLKGPDDDKEHLYGVDISKSTILKETGIIGEDMIAAIWVRSERQEKAIEMLRLLLK